MAFLSEEISALHGDGSTSHASELQLPLDATLAVAYILVTPWRCQYMIGVRRHITFSLCHAWCVDTTWAVYFSHIGIIAILRIFQSYCGESHANEWLIDFGLTPHWRCLGHIVFTEGGSLISCISL